MEKIGRNNSCLCLSFRLMMVPPTCVERRRVRLESFVSLFQLYLSRHRESQRKTLNRLNSNEHCARDEAYQNGEKPTDLRLV